MKAYIDASVLLRIVLRSPDPLVEWGQITQYVSSTLLRLECARTLHRLRFEKKITTTEIANAEAAVMAIIEHTDLVLIDGEVLDRGAGAFAVPLKALDAIHLGTAMMWRDRNRSDLTFATHDDQLAKAARAAGFEVIGR